MYFYNSKAMAIANYLQRTGSHDDKTLSYGATTVYCSCIKKTVCTRSRKKGNTISNVLFHRPLRFKQVHVPMNTTKLTIVEDFAFEKRQFLFIITSAVIQSSGTEPTRSNEALQYGGACPALRVVGVVWVEFLLLTFTPSTSILKANEIDMITENVTTAITMN